MEIEINFNQQSYSMIKLRYYEIFDELDSFYDESDENAEIYRNAAMLCKHMIFVMKDIETLFKGEKIQYCIRLMRAMKLHKNELKRRKSLLIEEKKKEIQALYYKYGPYYNSEIDLSEMENRYFVKFRAFSLNKADNDSRKNN